MDNMSCIDFLIFIYNWILEDFEEQTEPQPVYIEMQPLTPRIYPTQPLQIAKQDVPLMRQRKHVPSVSNYKHTPSGCSELETEGSAVAVQFISTPKGCAYHWHSTVCFESPDIQTDFSASPKPMIIEPETSKQTIAQTQEDVFETDFEIIEIADVITKED